MIKMLAATRRRPGMTHAEFADYLEHRHGALVKTQPLSLELYLQNHVFDGGFGAVEGTCPPFFHRDAVVELGFCDLDALKATFGHPYTRDVIGADGANFSDQATALSLLVREVVKQQPQASAAIKIMHWIKLADGATPAMLIDADRNALESAPGFDAALCGRVQGWAIEAAAGAGPPPPPGPAAHFGGAVMPRYDAVLSFWLPTADHLSRFRNYEQTLLKTGVVDPATSFFVHAHEILIYRAER